MRAHAKCRAHTPRRARAHRTHVSHVSMGAGRDGGSGAHTHDGHGGQPRPCAHHNASDSPRTAKRKPVRPTSGTHSAVCTRMPQCGAGSPARHTHGMGPRGAAALRRCGAHQVAAVCVVAAARRHTQRRSVLARYGHTPLSRATSMAPRCCGWRAVGQLQRRPAWPRPHTLVRWCGGATTDTDAADVVVAATSVVTTTTTTTDVT